MLSKGVDLSSPSFDDHNPIPKFSIREYVFNARSKDIKKNWPFSEKSLQLCLKHGVKNILPPFDGTGCARNPAIEKGNTINSDTESSNNATTPTMVKPIASSKVCPVCKTFSSTSNITLNAHIDQCLSIDLPIKTSSESKVVKHRIKPRKMRSLFDIYATAPHCTMEELQRRNGKIWSEKLGSAIIEKDEVSKGKEGADNIAMNGTKLQTLNMISESAVPKLGVNLRPLGKSLKGGKGNKPLSTNEKKQNSIEYLKLASQRDNKRSYKTRLASQVLEDQEKDKSMKESP